MQQDLVEEKKENKVYLFIRIIVFILIGCLIQKCLCDMLIPYWGDKYGGITPRIKGIYEQSKNSIDVLVLGNSDSERGISPLEIWEKYGITSYNLSTSMQTAWSSYYLLKEFCKYQKPEVLVFETDCLFEEKDRKKSYISQIYDNMRLSLNKVQAITDPVYKNKINGIVSYIFPILKYHTRWNEVLGEENNDCEKDISNLKGYKMETKINPYQGKSDYMEKELKKKYNEIPDKSLQYINKIIDFCKHNNIKILFVELPTTTSWNMERNNIISKFAIEHKIEFIDMNLLNINIDWAKDTPDKGNHLNIFGAEKVSEYIGDHLNSKYGLNSHKEDSRYSFWNDELNKYKELKNVIYK